MTDFIHEHPKEPAQTAKEPAYVPPKTEAERQKKVYIYVGALFTVAFLLIAWSSLMSRRGNEQLLSELKQSTSTLQSVMDQSSALEERVAELEAELTEAKAGLENAQETIKDREEAAEAALCAMDWLREIEREYGAKQYTSARTLIQSFEENELSQYLPAAPLHTDPDGADALSPAEAYEAIVHALFPNGLVLE